MRSLLLSVSVLVVSFGVLLAGNSLQFVALGLRSSLEGFSVGAVGAMTAAYFAGFCLGSLYIPGLVKRVGHVRSFAALASTISGVALAHPLWPDPLPWAAMRLVSGFCFAGLYMVVESWLNARASNADRGRVLSFYAMVAFGGYAGGPLLVNLGAESGFLLFVLISILVSFALVPVTLSGASAPTPSGEIAPDDRFSLRDLYRATPLGLAGMLFVGAAQGSFMGLAATANTALGLDGNRAAWMMSATLLCGPLLQYPLGLLSDRMDRRLVISGVSLVGGLGLLLLVFLLPDGEPGLVGLLLLALVTGAAIFPLYAIVIAHTNDWIPESAMVRAAATLVLAYSLGSVLGSPLASAMMDGFGPRGLFLFLAATMLLLGAFTVFRSLRRAAPEDRGAFAETVATPGLRPLESQQDEQLDLELAGSAEARETESRAAEARPQRTGSA